MLQCEGGFYAGFYEGGFYVRSTSSCRACVPGKYSTQGAPVCLSCQPGSITNASASTSCTLCLMGTYMPLVGATACEVGVGVGVCVIFAFCVASVCLLLQDLL